MLTVQFFLWDERQTYRSNAASKNYLIYYFYSDYFLISAQTIHNLTQKQVLNAQHYQSCLNFKLLYTDFTLRQMKRVNHCKSGLTFLSNHKHAMFMCPSESVLRNAEFTSLVTRVDPRCHNYSTLDCHFKKNIVYHLSKTNSVAVLY